ncbi:MAG: hypothetical protein JWQ71_2286 [Pedosphaera sp.]|nr:hypothetical protein [Pedosphaera sp.]
MKQGAWLSGYLGAKWNEGTMNSKFNPVRWAVIVLLGFVLGLGYVFLLNSLNPRDGSLRVVRTVSALRLSNDSIKGELIKVVESQLIAFRKDDYPKAYTFAGSNLRAQLPLPAFERMVKTGYPRIARSQAAQFGVILDNGKEAVVNIGILDGSGKIFHYQYFLKRERTGWKINGVSQVRFEGIIT